MTKKIKKWMTNYIKSIERNKEWTEQMMKKTLTIHNNTKTPSYEKSTRKSKRTTKRNARS